MVGIQQMPVELSNQWTVEGSPFGRYLQRHTAATRWSKDNCEMRNLTELKNMVVLENGPSNSPSHQLLLGSIFVLGLVSAQTDWYEISKPGVS